MTLKAERKEDIMKKLLKVLTVASLALISVGSVESLAAPRVEAKNLSVSKVKKANKELKSYLADEVKSYKNGDDSYSWSILVDKMTVDENGSLRVDLKPAALTLSKSELETVAEKSQKAGMAALTIADSISDEDMVRGVYTSLWSGKRALGHTKLSDHSKFVINQ